jgi:hypothetical protein
VGVWGRSKIDGNGHAVARGAMNGAAGMGVPARKRARATCVYVEAGMQNEHVYAHRKRVIFHLLNAHASLPWRVIYMRTKRRQTVIDHEFIALVVKTFGRTRRAAAIVRRYLETLK